MAATKKAPPQAGPGCQAGLQSALGRRAQRSGDALAQAAAPTEGGSRAEQGKWAGHRGWRPNEDLNGVTGAVESPGAEQSGCGDAEARESAAGKNRLTLDRRAGNIASTKIEEATSCTKNSGSSGHISRIGSCSSTKEVVGCSPKLYRNMFALPVPGPVHIKPVLGLSLPFLPLQPVEVADAGIRRLPFASITTSEPRSKML